MTTRLPWLAAVLSLFVCACPDEEPATGIQVYVRTDYGASVHEVRVDVGDETDRTSLSRADEMAFFLRAEGAPDAEVDVTLRGFDVDGHPSTPPHTFRLKFTPDRETVAVLSLSSHCPGGTRAVGGDLPDRTSQSGRDKSYSVCDREVLHEGTWAVGTGGAGTDSWQQVAVDEAGNVFAFGTFQDKATLGGTVLEADGAGDAYVAKYNAKGELLVLAQLGGTGDIESQAIALDGDGNPVVSGKFSGQLRIEAEQPTALGYDGFVLKLDFAKQQPALLWLNTFEGAGDQEVTSVTFGADGALWIGGDFTNRASDRDGHCRDTLQTDTAGMFVAQLEPSNGQCERAAKVEGSGQCLPTRVAVSPRGSIVAACTSWLKNSMRIGGEPSPFVFPASNWANGFVAQFDAALTLEWALSLGSSERCPAEGGAGIANITLTNDGELLVAGGYARCMDVVAPSWSRTLIASASNEQIRPFLLRIGASGELSSAPFFAIPTEQRPLDQPVHAQAICMDAAGGFAVLGGGGSSFDFGLGERSIEGSRHAWVARYSPEGTALWGDTFQSGTFWSAHSCAFDRAGNLFVGGDFTGATQPIGAAKLESKGDVDTFLVRYGN